MNAKSLAFVLPALTLIGCAGGGKRADQQQQPQQAAQAAPSSLEVAQSQKIEKSKVDEMVKDWPSRPKLAVEQMAAKYGQPTEASANHVIWMNAGPFKRIEVTRIETPHDFPKPHVDFIRHTVSYNVPVASIDDLTAFDSSVTVDKTAGELSAKCDSEEHNILALNLANDVIEGMKPVAEARKNFADTIIADEMGQRPAYVTSLRFQPQQDTAFLDRPNIPGTAMRAPAGAQLAGTDAEALAFLLAANENELLAANEASKKNVGNAVKSYASMLQKEHAKNQAKTRKLGMQIGQQPFETKAVEDFKTKGAEDLAKITPLEGKEFEQSFMSTMIKNHEELLSMIDNQLMNQANNAQVRNQLTQTRREVAGHLDQARKIQQSL